jgi:hypothetical protein
MVTDGLDYAAEVDPVIPCPLECRRCRMCADSHGRPRSSDQHDPKGRKWHDATQSRYRRSSFLGGPESTAEETPLRAAFGDRPD